MFRTVFIGAAMTIALAGSTLAFDLSSVETRTLRGLEGPSKPRDIFNVVIAATPLATEGLQTLAGRDLRARYWTILKNGIVPVHEHAERPATIFTLHGEIYEYRNDQEEPILHQAGGLSLEEGDELAHWWINSGEQTVRLIAFDVVITDRDGIGGPVDAAPSNPAGFDLPEAKGGEYSLAGFVNLDEHFNGEYGEGLALSHYRVVLQPGDILPLWTDPGEPALAYLEAGELTEHHSGAEGSTVRARETGVVIAGGNKAWWENTGIEPAELHLGIVEPLADVDAFKTKVQ